MKKKPPVPFAVGVEVYELFRAMRRYVDRRARMLGMTQEQWRALWHLGRNEGITQAGLAEILDIQPISLARTLERLAASGHIERRPDPNDRRALKLYLTAEAEPMMETLGEMVEEFRAVASQGMTAQQQAEVVDHLRRMRVNLEDKNNDIGTPPAKAANA